MPAVEELGLPRMRKNPDVIRVPLLVTIAPRADDGAPGTTYARTRPERPPGLGKVRCRSRGND